MAFLLPLILPPILDATANLAVGLGNLAQSSKSTVSFQIGSRVFTTSTSFPLHHLPYELREKIILMALEASRFLILPPPVLFRPHQPLTEEQFAALHARSPLNPANPNYRSIVGERKSANGLPISTWRWLGISREWWGIIKKELWRDCIVGGYSSWANFMLLLDNPDFHALPFVKTLSLLEGFAQPSDMYTILLSPHLKNLTSLSILPTFPLPSSSSPFDFPPRAFPFGLQLIPPRLTLQIINLGLPLDLVTNEASRQHLARLKPKQLALTFVRPRGELFEELEGLLGGRRVQGGVGEVEREAITETLSLRYIPSTPSTVIPLVDPRVFVHLALRSFPRLVIYLPRFTTSTQIPYEGDWPVDPPTSFSQRVVDLVASDEDSQGRVSVWAVGDGLDTGEDARAEEEEAVLSMGGRRLWPVLEKREAVDRLEKELGAMSVSGAKKEETWQRQTDLRLFGGLIGVRMESWKG